MRARAWIAVAAAPVAIIAAVAAVGTALAPENLRAWSLISGVMAVALALQSVGSDPRELSLALLASLPPVMALASEGSPTWLIGPLAALLLVAGELSALSWECRVPGPARAGIPRRLLGIGGLGSLGLGGSLVVYGVATTSSFGGTGAVVVAAIALSALAGVVLRDGEASASARG